MPRKKAAVKSEAEETTGVLGTKEPERAVPPNEGPAEIGQAGDEASCAGVLEPPGEEKADSETAASQRDMSVADMLLSEENADNNTMPLESDMLAEELLTEEILAGTLLESDEDTFRTQGMETESADDEPMSGWEDVASAEAPEHFGLKESEASLEGGSGGEMPKEPALDTRAARAKAREEFFGLDIKKLDRELSPLQKKEWTDIYPFDGADTRHPVGSDRQAIVTNRYRGGVFCRLADTTTCMCLFGRGYTEYDCNPGDRVIVHITRYDYTKKHIYGRIVARW